MNELKKILFIAEKIKLLENEINFLRTLLTKTTQELSPIPWTETGYKKNKLESLTVRLIETEDRYKKLINAYQLRRQIAIRKILKIKNPNEMKVIYKRYILGKTLTEIAEEMDFSYKWVQTLHKKGVSSYENVI